MQELPMTRSYTPPWGKGILNQVSLSSHPSDISLSCYLKRYMYWYLGNLDSPLQKTNPKKPQTNKTHRKQPLRLTERAERVLLYL